MSWTRLRHLWLAGKRRTPRRRKPPLSFDRLDDRILLSASPLADAELSICAAAADVGPAACDSGPTAGNETLPPPDLLPSGTSALPFDVAADVGTATGALEGN